MTKKEILKFLNWLSKDKEIELCSYDGYSGMFSGGWKPIESEFGKNKIIELIEEFNNDK